MFAFVEDQDKADIFRETSVAFAYTISTSCGDQLKSLVDGASHGRLGDKLKDWTKQFSAFWDTYGAKLMHKLTGMRDPMLDIMINDSKLFNRLLKKLPPSKVAEYKKLQENKHVIEKYHERLKAVYADSPGHMAIKRGEGYYSGEHFRMNSDSGMPMASLSWATYLDENLTNEFGNGSGSST